MLDDTNRHWVIYQAAPMAMPHRMALLDPVKSLGTLQVCGWCLCTCANVCMRGFLCGCACICEDVLVCMRALLGLQQLTMLTT